MLTYRNFFRALKKCNKTVNFKFSVQEYNANCIFYITEAIRTMRKGIMPQPYGTKKTVIRERGKEREITPIDIKDRVMRKVLCDEALIPSICPHLIYDNGASLKGKGVDFARKRLNLFLEEAKKEYGVGNLYALTFDFKRYFENISHAQCRKVLAKYISDERISDICTQNIICYALKEAENVADPQLRITEIEKIEHFEGKGICLGSQDSQIMAVAVPNELDHYIKDELGERYYLRYMDDGIVLSGNKDHLFDLEEKIREKAAEYGLILHPDKTKITKLTNGVTFLKIRYRLEGDKTVKKLEPKGIARQRQRLKRLKSKMNDGKISPDDVYMSMQSWNGHAKNAPHFGTEKTMFKLYDELYGGYRMTRRYYKEHPEIKRRKKATDR